MAARDRLLPVGLLTAVLAAGPAPSAVAQEAKAPEPLRDHLQLGVGYFDVFDGDRESVDVGAVYRPSVRYFEAAFGNRWRGVGPQVGLRGNTDGGILGHAGFYLDIRPAARIVVWPGINVGGWRKGDSRDLGGTFQFMSELYVGYRLGWGDLVGVSLQHVSNAGLHERNPGGDTVMLTYTVAFGPVF
jgi:hypothetical protein